MRCFSCTTTFFPQIFLSCCFSQVHVRLTFVVFFILSLLFLSHYYYVLFGWYSNSPLTLPCAGWNLELRHQLEHQRSKLGASTLIRTLNVSYITYFQFLNFFLNCNFVLFFCCYFYFFLFFILCCFFSLCNYFLIDVCVFFSFTGFSKLKHKL